MRDWTKPMLPSLVAALCVCGAARAQSEVQSAVARAGLTPTMLTACGLTVANIQDMSGRVNAAPELSALLAAHAASVAAEAALKLAMQDQDPLEPEGYAAIRDAVALEVAARVAFDDAATAFVQAAITGLAATERARVDAWLASAADLPPEFRVIGMTRPESQLLMGAILEERRANAGGGSLPAATAQLLVQERARPDVAAAADRIQTHLALITSAFEQAFR